MAGAGVDVWVVVPGAGVADDVAVGAGPWGQVYVPVRALGRGASVGFSPDSFSGPGDLEHAGVHARALTWMRASGCTMAYAGWSGALGCAVLWSGAGQAFVGVQPPR